MRHLDLKSCSMGDRSSVVAAASHNQSSSTTLQDQDTAQYIVVSHKPEVYELARTLVGVYQTKASSASVTAQL